MESQRLRGARERPMQAQHQDEPGGEAWLGRSLAVVAALLAVLAALFYYGYRVLIAPILEVGDI